MNRNSQKYDELIRQVAQEDTCSSLLYFAEMDETNDSLQILLIGQCSIQINLSLTDILYLLISGYIFQKMKIIHSLHAYQISSHVNSNHL